MNSIRIVAVESNANAAVSVAQINQELTASERRALSDITAWLQEQDDAEMDLLRSVMKNDGRAFSKFDYDDMH